MSNSADTIVPTNPVSERSLILSIGMLIVHVQAIIRMLQEAPVKNSASDERSFEDFLVVGDTFPRQGATNEAATPM
jgi:hypothetical protein